MAHVTISDNEDPRTQHNVGGTPTSGPFTFNFVVFDADDVSVYIDDAETPLAAGIDYSISLTAGTEGGYIGGNIVLTVPVSNVRITLAYEPLYQRLDDFPTTGIFNITTLNTTLDRFVTLLQHLRGTIGRTIVLPVTTAFSNLVFPAPEADKALFTNSAGDGLEWRLLTGLGVISIPVSVVDGGTGAITALGAWNNIKQMASQSDLDAGTDDVKAFTASKLWATKLRGGWKNIVGDNHDFEVAQRGGGATPTFIVPASSNLYTFDRWYMQTGANQASSVGVGGGLNPQSLRSAILWRSAGQSGTTMMFFGYPLDLDEIIKCRGKTISILLSAQAGANWSPANGRLTAVVACGTGVAQKRVLGFTAETILLFQNIDLVPGGAGQTIRAAGTVTVPNNATQMEVFFQWTPVGVAGANDWVAIGDIDVRSGEPYIDQVERKPFHEKLRACMRHFCKSFPYATAPASAAGGLANSLSYRAVNAGVSNYTLSVRFPVQMRVTPTITFFNPAAAGSNWRNNNDLADSGASAADTSGPDGFGARNAQVAGDGVGELLNIHFTADAGI
jgi:hypothetical protein